MDLLKSSGAECDAGKRWSILLNKSGRIPSSLPRSVGAARAFVYLHDYLLRHLHGIGVKDSTCCPLCHQGEMDARRRFVEWAQNEIAVVPDFHKRILFSDEAHFWLNGYVNKQNCRIWSEATPQVYVETPLHPEKLTVWCALWAGGILLQKR
ncbi:hypothetical protein TNCV_4595541 [Trichonephila clavipes]|uniref:Transposase n=1 Tax=Trichonephila clavipes TaxID=2585209 RepID=A0A8X6WFG3_TRICX|nr:hypothetical protein TNCV_4595541 [Trichonephila clavipes]